MTTEPCMKRRYATVVDAITALRETKRMFSMGLTHRKEHRFYFHSQCQAYHLTSEPYPKHLTPLKVPGKVPQLKG